MAKTPDDIADFAAGCGEPREGKASRNPVIENQEMVRYLRKLGEAATAQCSPFAYRPGIAEEERGKTKSAIEIYQKLRCPALMQEFLALEVLSRYHSASVRHGTSGRNGTMWCQL